VSSRRRLVFFALVAAQLIVPLGLIGVNELALATGTKVTLATAPVDPLDPFRGRYVELDYEISNLPDWRGRPGAVVWVELVDQGEAWGVSRVHTSEPDTERPFIRGQVRNGRVEYGIETYYADEDEAPRLEGLRGRLLVDVVLDDDGKARIDGVRVR
jgi:uncharacterized membrane-anchored protein